MKPKNQHTQMHVYAYFYRPKSELIAEQILV